jgi:putative acetyltransferase
LVDRLRTTASPYVSLVAVASDVSEEERQHVSRSARRHVSRAEVVGHIFFSPVTVERAPRQALWMGLAPMAVQPERQRRGIGSALVRGGLAACRALGAHGVVVLGHPQYYPRFGFAPAARFGLRSTYSVPDDTFMALELAPGARASVGGLVRYAPAFDEL